MRTTLRGLVTLGTVLALFAPGAQTAAAAVSLSLNPSSGGTGTGVTVSGSGFGANEGVIVGWDQARHQVTTATADGNGNFSTSFAVPNGSSVANHTVFATGLSSHFVVTSTFNVTSNGNVGGANLALRPASGRAGSTVTLNGTGFSANEQVNLAVDGGGVSSPTSDGSGNFATTLQLSASLSLGAHTISATGASSGHSASVTFFVTNQNQGARQAAAVACSSGDEQRPGNGFGDDNHCHTGSQGHHDDGDNGHGNGHGHGNDDDQGDDD